MLSLCTTGVLGRLGAGFAHLLPAYILLLRQFTRSPDTCTRAQLTRLPNVPPPHYDFMHAHTHRLVWSGAPLGLGDREAETADSSDKREEGRDPSSFVEGARDGGLGHFPSSSLRHPLAMQERVAWYTAYSAGSATDMAATAQPSAAAIGAPAAQAPAGTAGTPLAVSERRLRDQLDATCFLVDQLRDELQQRSAAVAQLRIELEEERARASKLEVQSCQLRTHTTVIRRGRGGGAAHDGGAGGPGGSPQLVGSMTSMEDDKLRQTSEMARLEAEVESMRHMASALQVCVRVHARDKQRCGRGSN